MCFVGGWVRGKRGVVILCLVWKGCFMSVRFGFGIDVFTLWIFWDFYIR